jgi:hypothetical protein
MDDNEKMELHCREVKEIFETQPPWIIRWGILVVTLVLLAAAFVTWLFYK